MKTWNPQKDAKVEEVEEKTVRQKQKKETKRYPCLVSAILMTFYIQLALIMAECLLITYKIYPEILSSPSPPPEPPSSITPPPQVVATAS